MSSHFLKVCIVGLILVFLNKASQADTYEEKVRALTDFMALPDVVYLNNVDSEGWPQSRAMINFRSDTFSQNLPFSDTDFSTFFVTSKASRKVIQFMKDNKAGVFYYLPRINTRSLYVLGTIEVIEDKTMMNKYINKDALKLYSSQRDFDGVVLLKFNPEKVISYYRGKIDAFTVK